MRRFREQTTETAGFYNTVGFNDDTRAFLSIPARHDVARRVDCSFLARLVAEHRIGEDEAAEVAVDLAYKPAEAGLQTGPGRGQAFKGQGLKPDSALGEGSMFKKTYHATHPDMMEGASNEALRDRYLIGGLFAPGEVVLNYSHNERFVVGGAMPSTGPVSLPVQTEPARPQAIPSWSGVSSAS